MGVVGGSWWVGKSESLPKGSVGSGWSGPRQGRGDCEGEGWIRGIGMGGGR